MHARHFCAATVIAVSVATAQDPKSLDEGRKLFAAGQFAEASRVLTPLGATDGEAAMLLCRIAHDGKDSDGAVRWGEQAVKHSPESALAHLWLGRAYIQQLERGVNFLRAKAVAGRARAQFDRAIELDPANYDAREARAKYYLNAPGIAGGSTEKARSDAEVARTLNAYRGSLLLNDITVKRKELAAAELQLDSLVRSYPDSASPFNRLVNMRQTAGRFAEAFTLIDDRARRLPNDASARYQLGKTSALSGQRLDNGETALRTFIGSGDFALGPEAHAHYRLGMILELRKDVSGAVAEYETAVRLDPSITDAGARLKRLKGR
jgi:tetratricopeptide (TPR) repeat protein